MLGKRYYNTIKKTYKDGITVTITQVYWDIPEGGKYYSTNYNVLIQDSNSNVLEVHHSTNSGLKSLLTLKEVASQYKDYKRMLKYSDKHG